MTRNTKNTKLLEATNYTSRIMGRHVLEQHAVRIDWPGVRLEFDGPFHGTTSIQIRMMGRGATFGYCLTPIGEQVEQQEGDTERNGEYVFVSSRQNKLKDYPLVATDCEGTILDPKKSYRLSLWKLGDPRGCGSTIAGLVVDEACAATASEKPCNPFPLPGKRLIEFVGDSNTVGYGIKGERSGYMYHVLCEGLCLTCFNQPTNLITTTDTTKSWGAHVANALDADYHIVAWSGIGAKHSAWGTTNMIQTYGRLLASDPKTHVKDLQLPGPCPDAIVIMIGQNDTVNTITNPDRLKESFHALLKEIRKYRPAPTPIVIVVPTPDTKMACVPSKKENQKKAATLNQVWKSVISKESKLDVDANIHLIENNHEPPIPDLQSREDYGMFLHWNENANEKWARGLLPKLHDYLNWGF